MMLLTPETVAGIQYREPDLFCVLNQEFLNSRAYLTRQRYQITTVAQFFFFGRVGYVPDFDHDSRHISPLEHSKGGALDLYLGLADTLQAIGDLTGKSLAFLDVAKLYIFP